MPETEDDKVVAMTEFPKLGITKENTWVLTDPDNSAIKFAVGEIALASLQLKKKGSRGVVFVYNACHGHCKDGN